MVKLIHLTIFFEAAHGGHSGLCIMITVETIRQALTCGQSRCSCSRANGSGALPGA